MISLSRRTAMNPHKYKVGQRVRFFQHTSTLSARKEEPKAYFERYEVTRLLPNNGTEFQYRIKACTGSEERVVTESEIG
jgi:hypothetical protein